MPSPLDLLGRQNGVPQHFSTCLLVMQVLLKRHEMSRCRDSTLSSGSNRVAETVFQKIPRHWNCLFGVSLDLFQFTRKPLSGELEEQSP